MNMFFVIPGYFIAAHDRREHPERLVLNQKFLQTILRILPALFVMFLVTSILAYVSACRSNWRSIPEKYCERGRFDFWVGVFASTAGYFDAPARDQAVALPGRWAWRSSSTLSRPC